MAEPLTGRRHFALPLLATALVVAGVVGLAELLVERLGADAFVAAVLYLVLLLLGLLLAMPRR